MYIVYFISVIITHGFFDVYCVVYKCNYHTCFFDVYCVLYKCNYHTYISVIITHIQNNFYVLTDFKKIVSASVCDTVLPEIFAQVLFSPNFEVGIRLRKLSERNFLRIQKF